MIAAVKEHNESGLSDVMRDFKSHTSREVLRQIPLIGESRKDWLLPHFGKGPTTNQVWQEGMHPVELYTKWFTDQKMDYIHNNPVVAGIVEEAQHYLFSSARDYFDNRKGLVDISYIE